MFNLNERKEMTTQGFSMEEKIIGEKLQNKLYPYINGQRKKVAYFDKLVKNLTKEEINSGFLSNIEYGYDVGFILSDPRLENETLDKAAVGMVSHAEFDDHELWFKGINTLFRHGAANPYRVNENPEKNPMWPLMSALPQMVLDGFVMAPMPKNPKDAKAFLKSMMTIIDIRERARLAAEKQSPKRQKVSKDLKELDETMKPSALRQRLKRQMVADYRKDHPKSKGSR